MLGGGGSAPTTRIAAPGSGGSGSTAQQACATDAASRAACNAFSSADNTWEAIFARAGERSEEHTSELQSLMRISYAVFCLKKKKRNRNTTDKHTRTDE